MKTYKGFDKDLKCRNFQYEIGKTYEHKGSVEACSSGFHACENPLDIFGYYDPANSRFCETEQSGVIKKHNGDSKIASSIISIKTEINLLTICKFGVAWILKQVDFQNAKATNTGYRSAATNTGYRSAATNTGNLSAATNTGNLSAATNTGNRSAATNTGDQSAATNTGNLSAATNTGYRSAATNTGNLSAATNTGDQSAATNTGDQSAATNTGNLSAATNTGYQSAAIVSGKESIAMASGYKSKAKGALGCWLVLAEWDEDCAHIINVKSHKVDGKHIKADTFYTLKNNTFVISE